MHIVKKHFPVEVKIDEKTIEIGRFLREIDLKVIKASKNEEELYFDGMDIDKVSLTCAVHGKDQRKFLVGSTEMKKLQLISKLSCIL